jgi:hypothetical protein
VRKREACKIRLTQKRAVPELLLEYGMQNATGKAVPMSVAEKPNREGEKLDTTPFPCARLVGSLLISAIAPARHHPDGGSSFALRE